MIPAFINPGAGNAKEARDALRNPGDIEIREADPANLVAAIRVAVREGARRIIVAGGDGTIAAAASVVAGTDVSIGILPAGTLNHLARDLGIPLDLAEAARVAVQGEERTIDVGRAGDRIFLNTSSVGAYVLFVRIRERLEPRLGYWLASLVASARLMLRLRRVHVELEADGERRCYRTPLIFIGVGERELKAPKLGGRVTRGRRGLHVIVVQSRSSARLLALAFGAAARGLRSVSEGPALDEAMVDTCRIELPFTSARVAVDGEIVEMHGPLEYTIWRDALRVVVPRDPRLELDSGRG